MIRGVVAALWSLRGPVSEELGPTEIAVRYRAHARRGIAPLADIYMPARPIGASVMLVHGGAFVIGSRRMKPMRTLASQLCGSGIAVCAIDYRLMFRGGRLDEAVDDVCDAVEFWRARTVRYRLDARAVSLVGLSAGASLAMLATARNGSSVNRLVCGFGLYEMDHLQRAVSLLPRLLFRSRDRASWRERSPRDARQPVVPTLLLHGSDDQLVPVEQARRLAAHREALGLPTRLVIYPGAPHGFFNVPSPVAAAGIREIIDHVTNSLPKQPPAAGV